MDRERTREKRTIGTGKSKAGESLDRSEIVKNMYVPVYEDVKTTVLLINSCSIARTRDDKQARNFNSIADT
jgi:hypothetical protein